MLPALLLALIHRSAWKTDSRRFVLTELGQHVAGNARVPPSTLSGRQDEEAPVCHEGG